MTVKEIQVSSFAEKIYKEQKESFIQNLAQEIENSIQIWKQQIQNGEFVSLEESKNKIFRQFSL